MTHIRDVKMAMNSLKAMFKPIREGCGLLKKHGCPVIPLTRSKTIL
jgi:hypothetical protein